MVNPEPLSTPDPWHLYEQMLRCRLFEKEVIQFWQEGEISGEMHLSMGEEGVVVGIVDQLIEGDAMALDHRGTAPILCRGVDPTLLLKEFLGKPDGLCGGMGGHMHLFSPQHMAASSGIVGASGPAACGFALANQRLRPGNISIAFFGEGAVNEGMMMEAFNLAAVWQLPVLFVCKDDGLALMTQSSRVSGGNLLDRARSFGLRTLDVDGSDVEDVWNKVKVEIERLRKGEGPVFVHALCAHLEGHFLGDALIRLNQMSLGETMKRTITLIKAHFQTRGAPLAERSAALKEMLGLISERGRKYRAKEGDPLPPLRKKLSKIDDERLRGVEGRVKQDIDKVIKQASVPATGERITP